MSFSETQIRTYYFAPIRDLDSQFPVDASLDETFGDLTNRFCSLYSVPGGIYIIDHKTPSPDTLLSSLPADKTKICIWGNPECYPPNATLKKDGQPLSGLELNVEEEEEEEEDSEKLNGSSNHLLGNGSDSQPLTLESSAILEDEST
jgi:hypothetical protein